MFEISETHIINGAIVGYFLSMAKSNGELAGKYLKKNQYHELLGMPSEEKIVIKDINPAKTEKVNEPKFSGIFFRGRK